MDFYWVVANNWSGRALDVLGYPVNILISAGHLWTGSGWRKPFEQPLNKGKVMLDSGAQQFNTRFKRFPYTAMDYIALANRIRANYLVSLDVPLDFVVARGEMDYKEGLEITVRNAKELIELYRRPSRRWTSFPVPVIQGLKTEWFVECIEMYGDLTQEWPMWAIGSVCLDRSPKHILEVCKTIRRILGPDKHLHAFGPSVDGMRKIYNVVDSVDSSMWLPPLGGYTGMKQGPKCILRYYHKGRFIELYHRAKSEHSGVHHTLLAEMNALEFQKFLNDLNSQRNLEEFIYGSIDCEDRCLNRGPRSHLGFNLFTPENGNSV